MLLQRLRDRAPGHPVTEPLELSLDPAVPQEGCSCAMRTMRARIRLISPGRRPIAWLLEDAILLAQIVNDLGLLAVDPPGEGGKEELPTEGVGSHAPDCDGSTLRRRSLPWSTIE